MEQLKIKLNEVEYTLKPSTRSLLKFEDMTKKSVSKLDDNFSDIITLFYCMLYGANKDIFKLSFDEFIDIIDDNQESIEVFTEYLKNQAEPVEDKKKIKKKV